MQPFVPTVVQDFFLADQALRRVALKARQLGLSTASAIDFLDDAIFTKNLSCAIVADKEENAENIFEKTLIAWDNFPQSLKQLLNVSEVERSKTHLKLSNGSLVRVGTTIHSGTYQRLHLSEYGPLCSQSPEKAAQVKTSAIPTVPSDGRIIVESTAEGEGNDFHALCMTAMDDKRKGNKSPLAFSFHFFPWYLQAEYRLSIPDAERLIPSRIRQYARELKTTHNIDLDLEQLAWYAEQERLYKDRMKEQFPSTPEEAFLATGDKLFSPEVMKRKMDTEVRSPIEVRYGGSLCIYSYPQLKHVYAIGADVAQGISRDSCTAQIVDFTSNEVVATYADDKISPTDFAYILSSLGHEYHTALLAPESNNHGHATIAKLLELNYPNLYQFEMKGFTEDRTTERIGWLTSQTTKPRMMLDLDEAFRDDVNPLKVPDAPTLEEARMYRKDDNLQTSVFHQKKNTSRHFDRLTALAIANQMRPLAKPFHAAHDASTHSRIQSRRMRNTAFV